ncbi:MAG: RDD family protein [Thermoanaerobaculia bacterium]
MTRFDEIDLLQEPAPDARPPFRRTPARKGGASRLPREPGEPEPDSAPRSAPILKRMLAFLTDLSLFAALALALSPLLSQRATLADTLAHAWPAVLGLAGFLLLLSLYYFAGCWTIWGKTIGGTIFETAIIDFDGGPIELGAATKRWASTLLSLAIGGVGFLPALFPPGHLSLPDRMSASRVVRDA